MKHAMHEQNWAHALLAWMSGAASMCGMPSPLLPPRCRPLAASSDDDAAFFSDPAALSALHVQRTAVRRLCR
jgi:hypothetical protein